MQHLINKYYASNNWLVLLALFLIYALALTLEFNFLFTDQYYADPLVASGKNMEFIQERLAKVHSTDWVNYPLALVVILFPAFAVAFCLNIGVLFNNYKLQFQSVFDVSLKASAVFAINYLLAVILKISGVINLPRASINDTVAFQSALTFFDVSQLPYWLLYPLQCVNISEVVFILFLAYGMKRLLDAKYLRSLLFVLLWYGLALLVWIVFTVLLQTINNY
ncbi:hypothetical protein FACS1894201_06340 [Bacteroidia bacterium]|nr:hypothetical protein FACS1894201_06340 [Bacteroidia bacterium]